jgi:polyisoprenoid-binding protein YceI
MPTARIASVPVVAVLLSCVGLRAGEHAAAVEVRAGTISFQVATTLPALRVHGTSNQLQAHARLRDSGDRIVLTDVDASVPVMSLNTGLALRDEHMRTYIFKTPDGNLPDVRLLAAGVECSPLGGRAQAECPVSGELAIRGASRPFAMTLVVRPQKETYRVAGDAVVKLSDYGITPPSQLGVTTRDDVKLHLEFTAKMAPLQIAANGVGR